MNVMKTESGDPIPPAYQSAPPPPAELADNAATGRSRSTDWYSEGQGRVVRIGSLRIVVTFLGRKGRRARVKIEAPAGAEFEEADQE
jgi:hypothetical protein